MSREEIRIDILRNQRLRFDFRFLVRIHCITNPIFLQDVDLASMLLRPMRLYSEENMSNELKLSNEKYGSVRRVFILAEKDELVKTDLQRWMIMKNRPDQVEEIKGSDHMVMISKPLELFVLLQSIGRNYS